MKDVSATEAARHFSDLLDNVGKGESYVVHRKGRPVAEIVPARSQANGDRVKELLRNYRPDKAWVRELRELRARLNGGGAHWTD